MPSSRITHRNRFVALAGVAAVAAPLAFVPIFGSGSANAEANTTNAPATTQATLPSDYSAPRSFAPIVAAVKPAVVTVTTKMEATDAMMNGMTPFQPGSPMDDFFRQFFGDNAPGPFPRPQPHSRETQALGSGFIIDANGTIVTNNHVIDNATSIKVTLDNGSSYDAKLIGTDAKTDLAVLKIEADEPLATVAWGDSDKLNLGDPVLAIGNPFGIGTTVTSGIVSARGRDLHNGPYDDFIQVDAAINHGNSGGPLIDMNGKVVGINSAIYSPNGGNVGVGFAIPSDQAKNIVDTLIKNGSIERGFIGVQIQPVTDDVASAIGLKDTDGALVASVSEGSPAEKAGIKVGDVITAFNEQPVKDPRDLARKVAAVTPGEKTPITVWRQDESRELSIEVGKYDNDEVATNANDGTSKSEQGFDVPTLGLSLSDITPDLRQSYQIPEDESGALIKDVDPDKAAADKGVREGDVILSVNQQKVKSASDARDAIKEAKKDGRKTVLLLIERNGTQSFIALPLGDA